MYFTEYKILINSFTRVFVPTLTVGCPAMQYLAHYMNPKLPAPSTSQYIAGTLLGVIWGFILSIVLGGLTYEVCYKDGVVKKYCSNLLNKFNNPN